MRPIDADKLWESIDRQLKRAKEIADGDDLLDLIVDVISAGFKQEIDNAPTVDAVEVVRCKECIYWNKEDAECPFFERTTLHDFYCWYGRREDG